VQVLLRSETDPKTPMLPPAAEAMNKDSAQVNAVCPERFVLRGVGGPYYGRSFPLCEPVIVGRGETADIRIDEPTLGERQARVEINGDRVVLRDFGGGDGTVLNGVPVRNALLMAGDQLAWEQHRFVLEAPGLMAPVQRHDTTPLQPIAANAPTANTTQAIRPITSVHVAQPSAPFVESSSPRRGGRGVGWLIAAAALIAAALTALLLYAPKLGG
jgi:hypothetical protein